MVQGLPIPPLFASKMASIDKQLSDCTHQHIDAVKRVLLSSDFALRHIDMVKKLLTEYPNLTRLQREDYFRDIKQLSLTETQPQFMNVLRAFRHEHFLRLLVLQEAGIADVEVVMQSWSDCADAVILHALDFCHRQIAMTYGVPKNSQGHTTELYTLAMGKLGGRELNFSSDIDLIFAYDSVGDTDGSESIPNQQFYSKLIQLFVAVMQQVTVNGFVFRVDLRLRPNGDSGPLVLSLTAMETYYQEQGRDWERYAMVKARVIAEQLNNVPSWFTLLITPFVYRRYVDFSVIESLRSMKALIEREVQLNPRLDDIKRGKGGIREVEFIIQSAQLIRGGRLPQIQIQNAMLALDLLSQEKLVLQGKLIKQAYLFLRQLENAIQSLNDQQSHSLPTEEVKQAQIALGMRTPDWHQLLERLHQYQEIISDAFQAVLGKVDAYEDERRLLANQLASLWNGHIEESMAINLLASLGYEDAPHCYQMIHTFRHSPRCRRLSQAARMRLDRFMVLLLTQLVSFPHTNEVLLQMMHLLENIVGRSAYLALLTENPQALSELLFWLSNSPFMTTLLVNHPFLLEVLIDQDLQWRPPSKGKLQQELVAKLSHYSDLESQQESLRQFKLIYWFMAARAEIYGDIDAIRISKFLSDLAEIIVHSVLDIACKQLEEKYPEIHQVKKSFTIVAYGKLGSREMNFTSDLDLVFLHNAPVELEGLVTRLTQKVLHMLTMRSQTGVLYPVDTRLRPSGAAGLLVSTITAFVDYQQKEAWTWEHQALIKARVIAGSTKIKRLFRELKANVLGRVRGKDALQIDVLEMRSKITEFKETGSMNVSQSGLLDLEFLVQFLTLGLSDSSLARYTNTMTLLKQLFIRNAITLDQYRQLKHAYQYFHHVLHLSVLKPMAFEEDKYSVAVAAVCEEIYNKELSEPRP